MARMEFSSHETAECAAQGGQSDALFELGLKYGSGREGDADLIEAHKWFNLAAMRGNDDAKLHRLEISRHMTKGEIALAQKRAREWIAKTAH